MIKDVLQLTEEQTHTMEVLQASTHMVLAYYWGLGYLRVIPVPLKQANEFAKLMQRFAEETETPGPATEAWNTLHQETVTNLSPSTD